MEFLEFIEKNKISLDINIKNICFDAITIMKKSNDLKHDYIHLKNLFHDLNNLIKYEKIDINYNVLLPAICWHDTWHAKEPSTSNSLIMFYRLFYEGYGSSKLFKKHAKNYPIKKYIIQKINVAIKKHVRTGWRIIDNLFYTPFQLETKILKDLDELDTWSIKRLELLKKIFFKNKLKTSYLKIMKWYLKNMMLNTTERLFYLDFSKNEFKLRKKLFIDWVIKNYGIVRKNPKKYLKGDYGSFFDMTQNSLKEELYVKL
ncbi:hypothetical protein HOD20_10295 [archaeon]|jgi:hypothetical protein|nr:hypothetical protein [archaeon]MBT4352899.1 hypothetical protein [archaeon]MBT4648455.1 hypothetical protein [archaeon]MBT6821736.1 hypothetical protein [archaeon]